MNTQQLMHEVQKRAWQFFWNESHPQTGLTKDRANNFREDEYTVSSLASTGYALAANAVAVQRGWLERKQAERRALRTLRFVLDDMFHFHGWLYHFVDWRDGKRVWNCEVSTIDTALFLAGALLAAELFQGEVARLVDRFYRRLDFEVMRTDGGSKPDEMRFTHGWRPEEGFLKNRWDYYCEHIILYILALGAPHQQMPERMWSAWGRPQVDYRGRYPHLLGGPLFVHQMSHHYIDLRGRRDRLGWDYWVSSVNATLANRQYCIDQRERFKTFDTHVWGITASDGPDGYRGYAPFGIGDPSDGTVAPTAPIGSVIFTPNEALRAMQTMYDRYGQRIWGRYGFSNAFNVDRDWWDQDVIGIDLGMALLAIENYRTGNVWRLFLRRPEVQRGTQRAGLRVTREKPPRPLHIAV
ncbi:MAG: glucoamylase family protein [Armatimonadota bacterium]|nr:hypothetical protein [Armatimonadota bacterium]MDW8105062.1 glucoamylase family protein [Armatimonadota bacterium]